MMVVFPPAASPMTEAARRPSFDTAVSTAGTLDVPGLQALAGPAVSARPEAGAEAGAEESARRGPFRPEVWLNARQRHASRLAAHYFRALDSLAVVAVSLLCAGAATSGPLIHAQVSQVLPFGMGAAAILGMMRLLGRYRFSRGQKTAWHLAIVAATVLAGAATALVSGWALRGPAAQESAYLVWAGLVLITLHALHIGWSDMVGRWRAAGTLTPNIVLVGATQHAETLIREALKRRDLNVLGIFDDRLARSPRAIEGVPVLGTAADLLTHKMTPFVDRIVLTIDPRADARVRQLNAALGTLPHEVTLLVEPDGMAETQSALDRLAAAPLADVRRPVDDDRRAFNKRVQDLVLGLAALVLLAIPMAILALFIRLDSPGPIFFRQRRHGFNQEEIVVWKFRSMKAESADPTASRQVTDNDDRITRIGRFIRKTSLDELPQLLNVIAGEMSLVGPRPHAIGMKTGHVESARLVADYAHRHRIKPGMTGWAAVNGSRGPLHTAADVRRRVQLDIDYIERQSLWMDLWIMAITVPVLLGDRAAIR